MTDTPAPATAPAPVTADPADNPVLADASGDFQLKSYDIAPEDQAMADEIKNFDPVYDTPGPVTATGTVRLPAAFKASMLPPALSEPITEALKAVPAHNREAEETRLVRAALYTNSLDVRIKGGAGPIRNGANLYQQECFAVAKERQDLERECFDLSAKLSAIDHVRHEQDPRTGQKTEVIVNKLTGHPRQLAEGRLAEVNRSLSSLDIEAQRRLNKALYETVASRKAVASQLEDHAEIERRAEHIAREERLQAQAETRARMRRFAS